MPHFVSTKDEMVENISDMTSDFACLKISALRKASRISGEIDQITIGPNSAKANENSEKAENMENEQNICNVQSPKEYVNRQNNKIFTQNGISFSMKKILLVEELQRKEKVWKEIERHWQNMKENGRTIQEHMVRSHSYMARERERRSAEKLAVMLAEEERIAEQEELKRRREQQIHVQRAQEQKEKMEKEVEEYGKRMKERDELIQSTVCLRDYFETSYRDIVRLTKMCKDKNAIGAVYATYAMKVKEMCQQIEMIDRKIKNGELDRGDRAVAEALVQQIDEILRLYRSEVERIDASYEENLARNTEETKEANTEEFAKQQGIQSHLRSVNNAVLIPATLMDADAVVQSEEKDSKSIGTGVEPGTSGATNSLNSTTEKSPVIAASESAPKLDSLPQYKEEHLCRYVDEDSSQRYVKSLEFLENYVKGYKDFLETTATKKFRFECQKAINIPVNAISGISEQHLRDKYDRLYNLLAGKSSPNVGQHTHGEAFCKDMLAKKIVSQGETLVSSKPKMAFPIAAVVVALWNDHVDFGELLLAHFYKTCPFTAPIYMPRTAGGQSNEEYYKLLGYKYSEDGSIEKQDKFLKRMSGLVRLYASITVTSQRRGVASTHPHGLQNAWRWLAATLNCDPRPEISDLYATFILDMLEVTGNALSTVYSGQFKKLLLLLSKQYYPRMQNSGGVSGGPLMRLEEFLKNSLASNSIPPPDGYLPRNFW